MPDKQSFRFDTRSCGILLHPTSLPNPHGNGDLGSEARTFVDFLQKAGQRWWQMLPTNPPGAGFSPYSACSAFAGSAWLIDLDDLYQQGLLAKSDIAQLPQKQVNRVDFRSAQRFRMARLRKAFNAFNALPQRTRRDFDTFVERNKHWLTDFALYLALTDAHKGKSWTTWDKPLRERNTAALREARKALDDQVCFTLFVQYCFDRQWQSLKRYANERGVGLCGDIPIFISGDSADVWAHQELFELDRDGSPRLRTGVPPDSFSKTGQLWGHPHYKWKAHQATRFAWWIDRFRHTLSQFDGVRIDHFLGFYRCWAVKRGEKTAQNGRYIKSPGDEMFRKLTAELGQVSVFAEDLGVVIPEALALRDKYGFPGMRILQDAFGDDDGAKYHLPHNYTANCVVCPGVHDHPTLVGWYKTIRSERRRSKRDGMTRDQRLRRYCDTDAGEINWDIIRQAYASVANTTIINMQDVLGLDNTARMNKPGTATGNWRWCMQPKATTAKLAKRLRELAELYQRDNA